MFSDKFSDRTIDGTIVHGKKNQEFIYVKIYMKMCVKIYNQELINAHFVKFRLMSARCPITRCV